MERHPSRANTVHTQPRVAPSSGSPAITYPSRANATQPRYTWLVSSDESGIGGQAFYGFGSLWMRWERRGDFYREFMEVRKRHQMPEHWEVKWSNLSGNVRERVAQDLVDWFFRRRWMMFHCVIVRKAEVDRTRHSMDLARRKQFVMLLSNKMKRCAAIHADRPNYFRVWVDPIHSSYRKSGEAAQAIANRTLAQVFKQEHAELESLQERDSKTTPSIQLCDLLLGAVMDGWQQCATKQAKRSVSRCIAERIGWPDLAADTFPHERKFNIWRFQDPKKDRATTTRAIKLRYPLPPRPGRRR